MSRIELRPPRWIHVPFLLGDIVLLTVFYQVIFTDTYSQGDAFTPDNPLPLGMKIVFGFFMAIGVFMFFVLSYRIIKAPPVLVMDSEGLYLNPAGVELGRFKWSEIEEIKLTEVVGSPTGRGGPRLMPAVAVVLKDPQGYIDKFPKLMSPLFKFRNAEAGTPLLLEPSMFGKRYDEIVGAMQREVARAKERGRA